MKKKLRKKLVTSLSYTELSNVEKEGKKEKKIKSLK